MTKERMTISLLDENKKLRQELSNLDQSQFSVLLDHKSNTLKMLNIKQKISRNVNQIVKQSVKNQSERIEEDFSRPLNEQIIRFRYKNLDVSEIVDLVNRTAMRNILNYDYIEDLTNGEHRLSIKDDNSNIMFAYISYGKTIKNTFGHLLTTDTSKVNNLIEYVIAYLQHIIELSKTSYSERTRLFRSTRFGEEYDLYLTVKGKDYILPLYENDRLIDYNELNTVSGDLEEIEFKDNEGHRIVETIIKENHIEPGMKIEDDIIKKIISLTEYEKRMVHGWTQVKG